MSLGLQPIFLLLASVTAFAQDSVSIPQLWMTHRQYQGGIVMPGAADAPDNDLQMLTQKLGVAVTDGEAFRAFRDAYDFAYAGARAGGLELNRNEALDFAKNFVGGNKPAKLQPFKDAFYDEVTRETSSTDFQNTYGKLSSPDEKAALVHSASMKYANSLLRAAVLPTPGSVDLEKEIRDWASLDDRLYGGGFPKEVAARIAEQIASANLQQGEGRKKLAALQELTTLLYGTTSSGNMQRQGRMPKPDLVNKLIEIVSKPGALEAVEMLKNDYRDLLLKYDGPAVDQKVDDPRADPQFEDFWNALANRLLDPKNAQNSRAGSISAPIVAPGAGVEPAAGDAH